MNDQSDTLFFSIVIPYFNRYGLAVQTVESVLKQTYTFFEVIIVDDGSTDGSGQKLEEHFRNETKVRVIHQQNLERGAARNRGFVEAKGRYVIFLDSDDLFLENHLKVLHGKIMEEKFPDLIATKYQLLRNGKRLPSSAAALREGNYNYRLFLEGNPFACHVCVQKTNPRLHLFEESRLYAMKEDWMFFMQNLRHQQLYVVDQVTVLFNDHPQRSVLGNNKVIIERTLLSEEWILKNIDLDNSDRNRLRAQVQYFCAIHCYVDGSRRQAFHHLKSAFRHGGVQLKYAVLLIKIIAGKKIIDNIVN